MALRRGFRLSTRTRSGKGVGYSRRSMTKRFGGGSFNAKHPRDSKGRFRNK